MKKSLFCGLLFSFTSVAFAQSIVTTTPQHSTAVLEEYTGIHCTFCPDGHKIANEIKADYKDQVILVNVHTGGYANPSGNEPDYRTPFGTSLAAQTNLAGYPSGTVSRHIFTNLGTTMALSRNAWRTAAEEAILETSPVTVGATSSYNSATRVLTVDVEAYYTADAANPTNKINVVLLQDSLLGPQTGGGTYYPSNYVGNQYVHNHMLRHMLSGQWGTAISNTTKGSLFTQTYTYTLPADYNGVVLDDNHCHLAVYVTESNSEVTHGISLGLNETNDGNTSPIYGSYSNINEIVQGGSPSNPPTFTVDFTAMVSGSNDYLFELVEDAPSDWSGSFGIGQTHYLAGMAHTVNISGASATNMAIWVTPGNTPDVGAFTLTAKLVADTNVTYSQKVHVISGVTDLVVDGSGSFGDGGTYSWTDLYTQGLNSAGNNSNAETDALVLKEAITNGAINGVQNLYMNIGWTFPSFSDEEVVALEAFMDNGGDVFVSGQDIGWDINDAAGNGTTASKSFYTNYLHADYVADGSITNDKLTAVTTDGLFGGVSNSTIIDKYGGNIYPDEMDPINGGVAVFNYKGDSTKVGGIRYQGAYKMVFLGIGIEMISDAAVRDEVVKLSYRWFNDLISVEEFDAAMKKLNVYPNPSEGQVTIPNLMENESYTISVFDVLGKKVFEETKTTLENHLKMDFKELASGSYTLKVSGKELNYSASLILK
mgnify:CR=1 FL=1